MELKLNTYDVRGVKPGEHCSYNDGVLYVNTQEIASMIKNENILESKVDIASPSSSQRIVCILDALKPIAKVGPGTVFPGIIGDAYTVGRGETNQMENVSVMACAFFDQTANDTYFKIREAIVDMSGETAKYSPFSSMYNIVVEMKVNPDIDAFLAYEAVRKAIAKVAAFIGSLTVGKTPSKTEIIKPQKFVPGLPNVCLILQLVSAGRMHDTILYGSSVRDFLPQPTLININELIDGAIMTEEYHYGSQRNPTYFYQDNPIARELYHRHAKDLNFAGIVLTRGRYPVLEDKKRAASAGAKLAEMLGADSAIITVEGGGNSHTDGMLTVQECEKIGIRTSIIMAEMGDVDSADFSLVDYVPEASAIVTTGNREVLINLPEVKEGFGAKTIIDSPLPCINEQTVPLNQIFGANHQIGGWNISMEVY